MFPGTEAFADDLHIYADTDNILDPVENIIRDAGLSLKKEKCKLHKVHGTDPKDAYTYLQGHFGPMPSVSETLIDKARSMCRIVEEAVDKKGLSIHAAYLIIARCIVAATNYGPIIDPQEQKQ